MSKKISKIKVTQQRENMQPAFVEALLKNGTTILTAKKRDELAEMINDIPADVRYCSGAVGYNHETGVFSLRVDLTND